jgi:hypothetical protein
MMCFGLTISRQWAKIGVDQRNDGTHFGDTEPDRQIFGPVRHDEAHRLALAEVLLERPARITVYAGVERAIGQALVRREQSRGVAACLGQLLDHARQNALRVAGDRRGGFERAHPVAQRGVIAAASRPCLFRLDEGHAR